MKKKSNVTKGLIVATLLITIITLLTTVNACASNRVYFMAIGDDLDLARTNNFIIGNIKLGEDGEPESAGVFFYSKIYDESGQYAMIGMTTNGILVTDQLTFYCPVFSVWFTNVWAFVGEGLFRTTDTNIDLVFRRTFPITMPNTEGQWVPASIFIWLSPTGEYYEGDPEDPNYPPQPIGEVQIMEPGWALAGVFWNVSIPMDVGFGLGILPIGPISYLTSYIEI
ncbi:MAG: hypothetical protein ACFE88_03055 [Candidatus Hermodarchaeota archaeon]